MKASSYVGLLLVSIAAVCSASKILVVLPFNARSHQWVMQPIIKALAERGHDINFYSPIRLGKNYTNVKEIDIKMPLDAHIDAMEFDDLHSLMSNPYISLIEFWVLGLDSLERAYEHPEMQKLIHSNDKYDLVILETHFGQESLVALGHKFNAPVVSLGSFGAFTYSSEFFGNPFGTPYIPLFDLGYDDDMTFFQRCHNTLRTVANILAGHYYYLPYYQDRFVRKYFNYSGSETMPPLMDMLCNVSLAIANSQIAVDYSRPYVPNIINTAGLHIAEKNKPLPKDLQDFLDNSKNGVVYISFGSLIPIEKVPVEIRDAFVKALKRNKINFLWKYPLDTIPGISKNVKLSKWIPQQDVLAHPNIKGFITHGGLLSQQETVYYGVPVIGVPFFGDQRMNIKRAEKHGYGVTLNFHNLTEESITWALNEILHNPKYQENVKYRSRIFKDNPEPPVQKAVYWIEYVLRYKGAPHLFSKARTMPYYQYFLLDVFAFFGLVIFLFLFSVYLTIRFVLSLCFKRKPTVKPSKKKN